MEWINIKNGLPSDDDIYLVYTKDGPALGQYSYRDATWHVQPFCQHWCRSRTTVTHWKPIPKSPSWLKKTREWLNRVAEGIDKEKPVIHVTINIEGDASALSLTEFEDRVYKIFKKTMNDLRRECGDDD